MGSIKLLRIDSRLSHGKTVDFWCDYLDLSRVIIANDRVAEDDFRKEVMGLTIPKNIEGYFLRVDEVKDFLEKSQGEFFIIVESPSDLKRLVDCGIRVPKVNVGIIHMSEGKRSLTEEVAVDDRDLEIFKNLIEDGVEIAVRLSPFASKKDLREFFAR